MLLKVMFLSACPNPVHLQVLLIYSGACVLSCNNIQNPLLIKYFTIFTDHQQPCKLWYLVIVLNVKKCSTRLHRCFISLVGCVLLLHEHQRMLCKYYFRPNPPLKSQNPNPNQRPVYSCFCTLF